MNANVSNKKAELEKEIEQLKREKMELLAQLPHNYYFAARDLDKAASFMGSAVILKLTALGGNEIISPVAIRDGLSKETIECLKKDLVRSYQQLTELKPRCVNEN